MSDKKKKTIDPAAIREGQWLVLAMEAAKKKNVDLSTDLQLNNDNLVSQWRKGYAPMSDLQMLKIGKILRADVYVARPRLLEYREAVGKDGLLDGLTEESRQFVINTIAFIRGNTKAGTEKSSS